MKDPKKILFLFSWCFLLALIIYGRALNYDFVYDDIWRVVRNEGLKESPTLYKIFFDRSIQSANSGLNQDNYRPLVTWSFALDYKLWRLNPFPFHFENVLGHTMNSVLMGVVGITLFELSFPAAVIGATFFMVHPAVTESVAWISGRSGVMFVFFILWSLFFWDRYRREKKKQDLCFFYLSFILGLLSRETAVCLPVLLVGLDVWWGRKEGRVHYVFLFLLTFLYVLLRTQVLGQFSQMGYWGGSFLSNLANVLKTGPLYLKLIFWPHPLRITYSDLPVVEHVVDKSVLLSALGFLLYFFTMLALFKKRHRISICFFGFVLFWVPGSNLFPLTTLFAERLIYPMMIFVAWGLAIILSPRRPIIYGPVLALPLLVLGWISAQHIPTWKNEFTLWKNSTRVSPDNWFAWACLGEAEQSISEKPGLYGQSGAAEEWRSLAILSYREAFKHKPPVDSGGVLFFNLARLYLKQGQKDLSAQCATRALLLRPDLEPQWKAALMGDVILSRHKP